MFFWEDENAHGRSDVNMAVQAEVEIFFLLNVKKFLVTYEKLFVLRVLKYLILSPGGSNFPQQSKTKILT